MGEQMPSLVKCSQCPRTFPVRAQMQFEGKSLPMLVVLQEVDRVEEAIEQATCQVCLERQGSADRGLYEVLKRLGLENEEDVSTSPRETAVVVHPSKDHAVPTVGVVVSDSRPREVTIFDPLMGTSIEMTHHELPARDRRPHVPRRDDWRPAQSEPRVPRALREPERREPATKTKAEPLTGAIGRSGDNAAVLEVAKAGILQRDEARRLERTEKFDKILFWLKLTLAKIRKQAPFREVWSFVETFERKLGEAVKLDAQQRGRKGLLHLLKTSVQELEDLCTLLDRLTHEATASTREHIKEPELTRLDAFEGGRRPEFWDMNGGKKPAFYEFEVVRTKSSLPIPNPPLPGGDEDPHPRIVYTQDGQYGPDYTVENSRREGSLVRPFGWELKPYGWALISLASWLGDHPDLEIGSGEGVFNLSDLICSYAEPIVMEEEDEPTTTTNDAVVEPTTTTSPELPATA